MQEPDNLDHQQARLQLGGAIGLSERAPAVVPAAGADILVYLLTQPTPEAEVAEEAMLLDGADRSVSRNPRHHVRAGELLTTRSVLPGAFVRLLPASADVTASQIPRPVLSDPDEATWLSRGQNRAKRASLAPTVA